MFVNTATKMPDLICSQHLTHTNIINSLSNSLYITSTFQSTKVDTESTAVESVHMTIYCIHCRTANAVTETHRLQVTNWEVGHKGDVKYIQILIKLSLIKH
jgi:hypothetical protein